MHNRRQLEGRERRERLRRFNSEVTAPPRPPVPLFALQLHQCGCLLWMYQVLHMYLEIVLCEKHRASELLSTYVFAPLFLQGPESPADSIYPSSPRPHAGERVGGSSQVEHCRRFDGDRGRAGDGGALGEQGSGAIVPPAGAGGAPSARRGCDMMCLTVTDWRAKWRWCPLLSFRIERLVHASERWLLLFVDGGIPRYPCRQRAHDRR